MCRGSVPVKRDDRGDTEVSVKICCDEQEKYGLKLAVMWPLWRNLDLRDQEEKERRGGEKEECGAKVEKRSSDRGKADLRLIIRYNARAKSR